MKHCAASSNDNLTLIVGSKEMYLVDTNEAQTQGGQDLNDSRATVTLDWEIGLQLWRDAPPAHVLSHQRTEVSHHKCSLIHLIHTENIIRDTKAN